jgi:alpha-galactosidase
MDRRNFLKASAIVGATAIAPTDGTSLEKHSQQINNTPSPRQSFFDVLRPPDFVTAYETTTPAVFSKVNGKWTANGITVHPEFIPSAAAEPTQMKFSLSAPNQPVSRIHLRWQARVPSGLRFLGDEWERAYGDLDWRGLIGDRVMPWYFLTHDGQRTHGYGVATAPNAMAFWRVDNAGVSIWLDVRNGGSPVVLGERTLELCTVITREGHDNETPWQAARSFCALLCRSPRATAAPVYGGNNWYYAYGKDCSAKTIERDAGLLAELTGENKNRPFQVIDDGWQIAGANTGCCSGGPWRYGNAAFPDMPGLAARLKSIGVRPGIWMRPLLTHERGIDSWALKRPHGTDGAEILLDPTIPEVRERISSDVRSLVGWGYELVKHDFSTQDLFGRFGPRMGASLTESGWSFHDRSRTTAEVIRDLYRAIREGAGEQAIIIGCNTIGHLGAGIFDSQRAGDDTSGEEWNRTRRMGVNTLAFRSVQHGAFFSTDADCVGITKAIPWELNKQWLDLLSRSGTPLFVSAAPDAVGPEQRKALREAFARAALPQPVAEPLDWLDTTTPEKWRCGGETVNYDWYGTTGDTTD